MIISHKYKFIYIKTRKTASTSIELVLSTLLDPYQHDLATRLVKSDESLRSKLGIPGPMNFYRHDGKGSIKWKPHTSLQNLFESELYDKIKDYMVISSIRNPYDRQVSSYYWDYRNVLKPRLSDINKLKFFKQIAGYSRAVVLRQDLSFENYIFTKCSTIMSDVSINGALSVDFWLRYETLESDFTRLSKLLGTNVNLGLVVKNIKTKNVYREKSKSDWVSFYADKLEAKKIVESVCKLEFTTGQYQLL